MTPILLVAHGSRDARAAASTHALVRAVATARPGVQASAAYLDHTAPGVPAALRTLAAAGHRRVIAVPLLLTDAYHGRVDLPALLAEVRAAGVPVLVRQAPTLAGSGDGTAAPVAVEPALIGGLRRRLRGLRYDGLVLAAAGTRDPRARRAVAATAAALADAVGVPCRAGYASACDPTPGEVVADLVAGGARRVVVASYFLAPGLLHDRAVDSARAAGAAGASAPLGAVPELVDLVLRRAGAAERAGAGGAQRAGAARAAARVVGTRSLDGSGENSGEFVDLSVQ
jgi:sirohydrochlorin ferrochelatase